jgi:protein TonB
VVVLDAVISSTGCVRNLRVMHSVYPSLNLAALVAVSEWQFKPTVVDGVPVPVQMNVTVNFTLK